MGGMTSCGYPPTEARRLGAGATPPSAGSTASRPVDLDTSTNGWFPSCAARGGPAHAVRRAHGPGRAWLQTAYHPEIGPPLPRPRVGPARLPAVHGAAAARAVARRARLGLGDHGGEGLGAHRSVDAIHLRLVRSSHPESRGPGDRAQGGQRAGSGGAEEARRRTEGGHFSPSSGCGPGNRPLTLRHRVDGAAFSSHVSPSRDGKSQERGLLREVGTGRDSPCWQRGPRTETCPT